MLGISKPRCLLLVTCSKALVPSSKALVPTSDAPVTSFFFERTQENGAGTSYLGEGHTTKRHIFFHCGKDTSYLVGWRPSLGTPGAFDALEVNLSSGIDFRPSRQLCGLLASPCCCWSLFSMPLE